MKQKLALVRDILGVEFDRVMGMYGQSNVGREKARDEFVVGLRAQIIAKGSDGQYRTNNGEGEVVRILQVKGR